MARAGFGREKLESFFAEMGKELHIPVKVYLLGGGAMCFRSQKNATKDLDLVFASAREYNEFIKILPKLGFKAQAAVSPEYMDMDATGIWDEPNGFRLDLFVNKVCGKLSLSKDIISRSELLGVYGKLSVQAVSDTDIVLFKSITERSDDAADIASIVRSSKVDWQAVLNECKMQSKDRPWYGALLNKLYEIKDKHGINAPIAKQVEELYKASLIQHKVSQLQEGGMAKEEIRAELKRRGFTDREIKKAVK